MDVFAARGSPTHGFAATAESTSCVARTTTTPSRRGDDTAYGGPGNDTLYDGRSDDGIYGGKGEDELTPGPGKDNSDGQDGTDSFYIAPDGEAGTIVGGDGVDTAYLDGGQLDPLDTYIGVETFATTPSTKRFACRSVEGDLAISTARVRTRCAVVLLDVIECCASSQTS